MTMETNMDVATLPAPPKTRRQVALLLSVVLLLGFLLGIVGDRLWLRRHWGRGFGPGRPGGPPGMGRGGPPEFSPERAAAMRRDMVGRLAHELNLTDTQKSAVDSILAAHETEFEALQKEMRPRMQAFADRTRSDIETVLTPEQKLEFSHIGPGMPGGPMGPGGPPPGPAPGEGPPR
jgi:Spy/CpxP family protein refolding chaperone